MIAKLCWRGPVLRPAVRSCPSPIPSSLLQHWMVKTHFRFLLRKSINNRAKSFIYIALVLLKLH